MSDPVYPSDEWQRRFIQQIREDLRRWNSGVETVQVAQRELWMRNLAYLERTYPHLLGPAPERPRMTIEQLRARRPRRRMSLAEISKRIR